ncbi:hypothetical protein LPLM1_00010 [Listeria phage LPML1]|nr:hypothetical protein LPLM1_00010 [Listeria phage LPML1]
MKATRLNRDVKAWLRQPIITQMLLKNIYQQQGVEFKGGDSFSVVCFVDQEDFFNVTINDEVVLKTPNVFVRPNGTVTLEVWREITVEEHSASHPEKAQVAKTYLEMFQKTIFSNMVEGKEDMFFEWSESEGKYVLQSTDGIVQVFSTEVVPDDLSSFLIDNYLVVKVKIVTAIDGQVIE